MRQHFVWDDWLDRTFSNKNVQQETDILYRYSYTVRSVVCLFIVQYKILLNMFTSMVTLDFILDKLVFAMSIIWQKVPNNPIVLRRKSKKPEKCKITCKRFVNISKKSEFSKFSPWSYFSHILSTISFLEKYYTTNLKICSRRYNFSQTNIPPKFYIMKMLVNFKPSF